MNKSHLKKIISEIVQRKLNEAKGNQVANIINDHIRNEGDLKDVEISNIYGSEIFKIERFIIRDGVLYIDVSQELNELDTQSNTQSSEVSSIDQKAAAADPTLVLKQKELAVQKKKLEDLTNKVKKAEANIAKREQTLKKANMKDQMEKDTSTRKQGPILKKIDSLQKDIDKKTGQS